jgi:hypothetical protein
LPALEVPSRSAETRALLEVLPFLTGPALRANDPALNVNNGQFE